VLIDKQGRTRYEYAGELNWQGSHEERVVTAKIEGLRAEQTTARQRGTGRRFLWLVQRQALHQ